jgi:NADPH:quinone reductase-like Zn-dependent oxidoreductase
LRYEDADLTRPGPGQVLVRVAATAFNPVDTWFRSGIIDQVFPVSFPHTLGLDLAGTVAELGPGGAGPRPRGAGDRVPADDRPRCGG